ncbi:MAG: QcrA and Rieske domain-containing protein [Nitrospirota bacterium]
MKKALYGLFALLGLGSLAAGLKVLAPVPRAEKQLAWFPLISEDAVPRSGVRKAELVHAAGGRERKSRVFIVSSPEGIAVLSAVCSHLGCLVNYRKETRELVCPCHGGKYDITGRNIAGPPPAPLTKFPVEVRNGMVMVGVRV